jgi:hypothetical protein
MAARLANVRFQGKSGHAAMPIAGSLKNSFAEGPRSVGGWA